MKYFLRVLFVLILAVAVVAGVYYGLNENARLPDITPETTMSKAPATEKHETKVLIASLASEDIYLYKDNNSIIISYKNKTQEFKSWGKSFGSEAPEIYCANFDNDKAKEIVIRGVDYKDENGSSVYCLYYLDPVQNKNGETEFSVSYLDRNNWVNIVDVMLQEKLTQLPNCKKIAQFAIHYASEAITYDKKTGLATAGYSGFFSTLTDENGKYMTIEKWDKGVGIYSVSADNKIFVDIPIMVSYKNSTERQLAGKIHFQLVKNKNGEMRVGRKSLVFITEASYRVSDPTAYSTDKWSYTEKNSDIIIDENDTNIDWIKYTTAFNYTTNLQTLNFGATATDIKNISRLTLTESYIELVAKKGCKFSSSADKGEFSVIINEGLPTQFDISYTAEITTNKQGNEVLKITFDKAYPKEQIKTLMVTYGAK